MFVGKAGTNHRMQNPRDASLGQALALLANILQGWKCVPGTITQVYWKKM
jgi:hypothetical protein